MWRGCRRRAVRPHGAHMSSSPRSSILRWLAPSCRATIVLCGLAAGAIAAPAVSRDEQVAADLRQRRQYDAAEKFCAERLADPRLSDESRVALTLELSRTWLGRALDAPAAAGRPAWQKAHAVLDEFSQQHPHHPRLLVIRVQVRWPGRPKLNERAKRTS